MLARLHGSTHNFENEPIGQDRRAGPIRMRRGSIERPA